VTGTVLLHFDSHGALVSDTLVVGALGSLFCETTVLGPVDQGCGAVGTAGVWSSVLTERDTTGACLFSRALPLGTSFALDAAQDVLLATTFTGTIDLAGQSFTSAGVSDLALAELGPSGELLWSTSFGAPGASLGPVRALGATAGAGPTLAVGILGTVDFGCGAVSSAPGADTLFAGFDAIGAVLYSRVVSLASFSAAGFNGQWPSPSVNGPGALGPVVDGLGGISAAILTDAFPGCPGNCPAYLVSRFAP
jgi:hypothetical protein